MTDICQPPSKPQTGTRLSIACPHCKSAARVRTSRAETPLVRGAHLQCTNVECGHTFAAQLSITHTIAPSRIPDAAIVLPIAAARRRPGADLVPAAA